MGAINVYNSSKIYQRKVIFTDPTVQWLSHKYTLYTLIALVPFISVSAIPSVLLCIYPTRVYRYLSRFLSTRKRLAITAFAEALHSCFKDGLNGTRDYRALAAILLLLLNLLVRTCLGHIGNESAIYTSSDLVWMMLVCVVSYIKPWKSSVANISFVFNMTLFGILMCAANFCCWNSNTWNDIYCNPSYITYSGDPPPGFRRKGIEFDWPETVTLEDVENFRKRYASSYNLQTTVMMLNSIGIGEFTGESSVLEILRKKRALKALKESSVSVYYVYYKHY